MTPLRKRFASIRRQPSVAVLAVLLSAIALRTPAVAAPGLALSERDCFSTRGLDLLVFNNWYDGAFSDAKIAGIELIHHDVRTATNGDVRLSATPEQWDTLPEMRERVVDRERGTIVVTLAYPEFGFTYRLEVNAREGGAAIRVVSDQPLPEALVGRAGFNLEFLPSAYFERTFYMDETSGVLPVYPSGPSGPPTAERSATGASTAREPFARGRVLTLAPEDPQRRVQIRTREGELALYDGRNQAQNGWYVVRTLLPGGRTGTLVEWELSANTIAGWTRPPMIAHSQVGYHPDRRKVAVVERDPAEGEAAPVRLLRVSADGTFTTVLERKPEPWGVYLRYHYDVFDFGEVREPGLYVLETRGERTAAFRIARDVYASAWQPTLDVFLPVQMDHMFVNEAYRVWHGLSHMDDARQAPPGHVHFDLYAQGPETDSPFAAGEHIPGLNIGGWYDAGDFDLRTQTQYALVMSLVHTWETFRPERDETTIDQRRRHVELHQADGVPDMLQQIEHGTLFLLAQQKVFGHAIPGVVAPDLGQYTHLGDGGSKTDNRIHDPSDPDSPADDRWAFTTGTTALNYGSAAALAAASRALRGWRDELAAECLAHAERVWAFEKGREPNLFRHGNTTGGHPADEEFRAALELLLATGKHEYAQRLGGLWPEIESRFAFNAVTAVRALPHMDEGFRAKVRSAALAFREQSVAGSAENPFGVPITRGGWAGNGLIVATGITRYHLHRAFPEDFDDEGVLRSLEYLHGCHPASNLSFVSAVGTRSKMVAYGMNRADYSYIAGGIVPGVLVLKPDFPENKEDWPFLWGENEYVVNLGGSYLFLVHAADSLLQPGE